MKLKLKSLFFEITPDQSIEPSWASEIKRWSQLDAESFVVAEATARSLKFLGKPDQLIILSSQGSSQTDYLFAHSNKLSPSLFVHTLPNVRSLVFSKLSGWEGAMFCFSQGKYSLVKFLNQALVAHSKVNSLIINLNRQGEVYQCDFYQLGLNVEGATHELEGSNEDTEYLLNDFVLREQFMSNQQIDLKTGLTIRKIS